MAGFLAIPDKLRKVALAFPDSVERELARLEDPSKANDLLRKADALQHYATRLKADAEVLNSIQLGRFKIVAKVGELHPRKKPPGKKTPTPPVGIFNPNTLARYRKVYDNRERIEEYHGFVQDGNTPDDTTGIDANHYRDYQRVQCITSWPVWLMFLHVHSDASPADIRRGAPTACPVGLFGNSIDNLSGCINHVSPRWGRHGMIYWAASSLVPFHTFSKGQFQHFDFQCQENLDL